MRLGYLEHFSAPLFAPGTEIFTLSNGIFSFVNHGKVFIPF